MNVRLPPSVVVLAACYKREITTDATETFTYTDLDLAEAEDLGPGLETITCHIHLENYTSIKYITVFWWSMDGRRWVGPVPLHSELTPGADPTISSAYTTATSLGLKMRYGMGVKNSSPTAKVERVVVTLALALTLKS